MSKAGGNELSVYYLVSIKMRLAGFLKPSAFSKLPFPAAPIWKRQKTKSEDRAEGFQRDT